MNEMILFLRERLQGTTRLAVLGAGSVLRSDDAAGVLVVEGLQSALAGAALPGVLLCNGETAPENYSGKIKRFGPTHLLVVDAADLGRAPGTVAEIRLEDVGGPTFCSHMLPLKVMLDYLKSETGTAVTLLGIQTQSIAFDGEMCAEVSEAVETLCDALRQMIGDWWGSPENKLP